MAAEDSEALPDLPHELIVEILARLPVKSLMRFKCVCKPWRSLISHPEFVKTHLSLASTRYGFSRHRLILSSRSRSHSDVKSCSLSSVLYEQSATAVDLDYLFKEPHDQVLIVGSCNGLVCIRTQMDTVVIWNPSTRKYKRLPCMEIVCRRYIWYVCGFGYDESSDDYKVVAVFHVNIREECFRDEVMVNTLKTDSWRRIGEFANKLGNGLGIFVNGALHWKVFGESDVDDTVSIVSLDLAKETLGEVLLPDFGDDYGDLTLGVLNGCLCMICDNVACADVWVMKEYGIRESWTKFVVIPHVPHVFPLNCYYTPLLCILSDGEVLLSMELSMESHLVCYCPKDGTLRYPELYNCSVNFDAHTYIESLVSPHADSDNVV